MIHRTNHFIILQSNTMKTSENKVNEEKNITASGCNKVGIQMTKSINNITKFRNDITKSMDDLTKVNDSNKISDETVDKDVELICRDDGDDDVIVIDDETEHQDDESLNSDDDCDDYLHPPPRTPETKMTLDQLADMELSEEDFDDNNVSDKETDTNKSVINNLSLVLSSLKKDINSKVETMNKTLNEICENWEISSLIDVGFPNVPNDEVHKFLRQYLTDRELRENMHPEILKTFKDNGIQNNVTNMSLKINSIYDRCFKVVDDYRNGRVVDGYRNAYVVDDCRNRQDEPRERFVLSKNCKETKLVYI